MRWLSQQLDNCFDNVRLNVVQSVKLRVGKKWLDHDGTTPVSELGVTEGTVIEVSTDFEEEL